MMSFFGVLIGFVALGTLVSMFTPRHRPEPTVDRDNDCCDDYGVPDDGTDYNKYLIDDGGPIFGDRE